MNLHRLFRSSAKIQDFIDRVTLFGLKTNGRTESILMSLPPTVRFEYNYQPVKGSEEDKLLQACLKPRDWV